MNSRIVLKVVGAVMLVSAGVTAQDRPDAKADSGRQSIRGSAATINMPEGITSDQADAILSELKQIRQLLEKQQAVRAAAPNLMPPTPEKVQMVLGNGWQFMGKDDAPITMVEFADFQCPFCRKFHSEAFAELKKNYIDTGKVRFVSRDLPLDFHAYSMKAAEASRCAGDQGKYWEMREALIRNSGSLNDELISKSAETLAIKMDDFRSCVSSDRHKSEIQKDSTEAATLQISGTPTFVLAKTAKDKLDGVKIVGALPYAQFQSAIEQMLRN